jgi:hypothetical protein
MFRTSSFCTNEACVEVDTDGDRVKMRDNKDPDGPVLDISREDWADFVNSIKGGYIVVNKTNDQFNAEPADLRAQVGVPEEKNG